MRKIMTLLLAAMLAFSLVITFAACGDDDEIKNNNYVNTSTSETTESNTSETTADSSPSNLDPSEDYEGSNLGPMRPL
jgi:uncharacterized lipoprotein YehR (DUF1307 family)